MMDHPDSDHMDHEVQEDRDHERQTNRKDRKDRKERRRKERKADREANREANREGRALHWNGNALPELFVRPLYRRDTVASSLGLCNPQDIEDYLLTSSVIHSILLLFIIYLLLRVSVVVMS
jgi:hypothetical protein